ncbi:MAG: Ldh family oxidoreductase [Caldilineaceae bacterium]|nr:Ldh family oxidoreductase [Caldilineaceae bacterium]
MEYVARIGADALHTFVQTIFERLGCLPEHAKDATDVLLYASRRGVETHGVRNLKPIYHKQITNGLINLRPQFTIDHETPISARVDGQSALGLVGSPWAMRLAMQKAQQHGIGLVAMHNSYHYGAAGYYPWLALQQDMIGVSMTGRFYPGGSQYGVMPTFGSVGMFSTNPLAISFPTLEEPPYLFDMATSTVPFNRIAMLRDNGLNIPLGWGADANGNPTTDPGQVRNLYPLGGTREQGGHKGYGLMMMVSILCNILSGSWHTLYEGKEMGFNTDGHFFVAMRIDLFRSVEEFKRDMDAMIRALHAAPKMAGQERIYVAGEIEHETEQERLRNGIPLTAYVVNELQELGTEFGVPLALNA